MRDNIKRVFLVAFIVWIFLFTLNTVYFHQYHNIIKSESKGDEDRKNTEVTFQSDDVVNSHNFVYILQPRDNPCRNNLTLLIMVHSAPSNYEKRHCIRQTWGNTDDFSHIPSRVIFVMGAVTDRSVQQKVLEEAAKYGDILQENFVDTYRNLTYKFTGLLKYAATYCDHIPYLLKTDDDVFVNVYGLMKKITSLPEQKQKRMMMCNVITNDVMRIEDSKWYVSYDDWPEKEYPEPCNGAAVIFSNDILKPLYNSSLHTKFFRLDDIYVTGILARNLGLSHERLNGACSFDIDDFQRAYSEGIQAEKTHLVCFMGRTSTKLKLWRHLVALYSQN